MSKAGIEAHKDLARKFVDAFNAGDLDAIDALLHDDFVWHVAIVGDDETEARPFQSNELRSKPNILPPVKQDKAETMAYFRNLVADTTASGRPFHLRLVSVMAEGDRVMFEAEGSLESPSNNRHYRNLYCNVLRVRDDRIVLYKEYQDTLHIYDVFVAD